MGIIAATLGKAECEMVAALVVHWHHVNGHTEWTPVSRRDLADLLQSSQLVATWARNPFWRPNPADFERRGFVVGWGSGAEQADDKGTLTDKFFAGIAKRFPSGGRGEGGPAS
jgi:hypothetical protein